LHNLSLNLEARQDVGLLIQSAVFQELFKFKTQRFYDVRIHFWRTLSGAEVDFILYKNEKSIIPIEIKFTTMNSPTITRAFRSFIDAYQPQYGFFITKDFTKKIIINNCEIHFISFARLDLLFEMLEKILSDDSA
jgi:predicted AAA+ superfamily ATPase